LAKDSLVQATFRRKDSVPFRRDFEAIAERISVVAGWANKAVVILIWATLPEIRRVWRQQRIAALRLPELAAFVDEINGLMAKPCE
jgi:hypothetical protein